MSPVGSIVSLDISNNEIGVKGAMTIAHSLHTNQSLRRLDISANNICGIDDKGVGIFDPSGIRNLCNVIVQTNRIESLAVGANGLMSGGSLLTADLLEHSTSLTSLDIGNNHLCHDEKREHQHDFNSRYYSGTLVKIAETLASNELLTVLDVSGSDMRYEGAITLSACLLKMPLMTAINLADNALGGNNKDSDLASFEMLLGSLEKKGTVTKLDLSRNSLKVGGAQLVANWLRKPSCVLIDLNLGKNDITHGNLKTKPEAHAKRYLYTEDNSGVKEVSQAISESLVLCKLDMRKNGVTDYWTNLKSKWEGVVLLDPVHVEEEDPKKKKKKKKKIATGDVDLSSLLADKGGGERRKSHLDHL
jgi:hypothetical protein